jgi:hypothetical protein
MEGNETYCTKSKTLYTLYREKTMFIITCTERKAQKKAMGHTVQRERQWDILYIEKDNGTYCTYREKDNETYCTERKSVGHTVQRVRQCDILYREKDYGTYCTERKTRGQRERQWTKNCYRVHGKAIGHIVQG